MWVHFVSGTIQKDEDQLGRSQASRTEDTKEYVEQSMSPLIMNVFNANSSDPRGHSY